MLGFSDKIKYRDILDQIPVYSCGLTHGGLTNQHLLKNQRQLWAWFR